MKKIVIFCLLIIPHLLIGQIKYPVYESVFNTPSIQTEQVKFSSNLYMTQGSELENAQQTHVYKVNAAWEIPATAGVSLMAGLGFKWLENKSSSSTEEILALNYEEDVAAINRWTSEPQYSDASERQSEYLFYGSFALGLIPALDKNMNHDMGRILLMYWETLALTGSFYSLSASAVNKYRPLAYSDEAPMDIRKEDNSKNSFPAGHPALTASSAFFVAKVFSDYYPERKGLKITLFSAATTLTLANAYLRWNAGKHFPTDLIIGSGVGAAIGILIPELHKIKNENSPLSLQTSPGGMLVTYQIR
jgi:hypothetical protein